MGAAVGLDDGSDDGMPDALFDGLLVGAVVGATEGLVGGKVLGLNDVDGDGVGQERPSISISNIDESPLPICSACRVPFTKADKDQASSEPPT